MENEPGNRPLARAVALALFALLVERVVPVDSTPLRFVLGFSAAIALYFADRLWPRVSAIRERIPQWILAAGYAVFGGVAVLGVLDLSSRIRANEDAMASLSRNLSAMKDELAARQKKDASISTQPAAMVVSENPVVLRGLPVISEGKEFAFTFGVMNDGPEIARELMWNVKIEAIVTPSSSSQEEAFAAERIERMPYKTGGEAAPKEFKFDTIYGTPPKSLVDDIRSERRRLYILMKWKWKDSTGEHYAERCNYLAPPGELPAWRECGSHNFIR